MESYILDDVTDFHVGQFFKSVGVFIGVFSGSFFLGFAMGLVTALVSFQYCISISIWVTILTLSLQYAVKNMFNKGFFWVMSCVELLNAVWSNQFTDNKTISELFHFIMETLCYLCYIPIPVTLNISGFLIMKLQVLKGIVMLCLDPWQHKNCVGDQTHQNLRLSSIGDSFVLSSVMDDIPHGWGS